MHFVLGGEIETLEKVGWDGDAARSANALKVVGMDAVCALAIYCEEG